MSLSEITKPLVIVLAVAPLACNSSSGGDGEAETTNPETTADSSDATTAGMSETETSAGPSETSAGETETGDETTGEEESPCGPAPWPEGMRCVAGGSFVDSADGPNELHEIANLWVDQTEVSAAAYLECFEAGGCTEADTSWGECTFNKPEKADRPINCVEQAQAQQYCEWAGKRLPTEWEWEWIARGGAQANLYPWGAASPEGRACWLGTFPPSDETCVIGSFSPSGDSPDQLQDLAGNVAEFTSSSYGGGGELDAWPVVRGGAWNSATEIYLATSYRSYTQPGSQHRSQGIRCVRDADG